MKVAFNHLNVDFITGSRDMTEYFNVNCPEETENAINVYWISIPRYSLLLLSYLRKDVSPEAL